MYVRIIYIYIYTYAYAYVYVYVHVCVQYICIYIYICVCVNFFYAFIFMIMGPIMMNPDHTIGHSEGPYNNDGYILPYTVYDILYTIYVYMCFTSCFAYYWKRTAVHSSLFHGSAGAGSSDRCASSESELEAAAKDAVFVLTFMFCFSSYS